MGLVPVGISNAPVNLNTFLRTAWKGSVRSRYSLKCHHLPAHLLRPVSNPPTMSLPARPLCPSRFVPTIASPCNAPSRTTLGHSKGKVLCGPSCAPVGDSLVIFPLRPGEPLSLIVTLPNEQRIEIPEAVVRWSRGARARRGDCED